MISHRPAKKNFHSMGLFSKYKPRSNIFMDLNPTGIKKPSRPYYVNQFVSDSVAVTPVSQVDWFNNPGNDITFNQSSFNI